MKRNRSNRESEKAPDFIHQKGKGKKTMKKKNQMRMGGKGLSLEAFAIAKSKNTDHYNPALIKKQREFYKNAKYVSKYKKMQGSQPSGPSSAVLKDGDVSAGGGGGDAIQRNTKKKKYTPWILKEIYDKTHEEQEKDRIAREAVVTAKKEEIERAQSRRKALKGKMLKRTRSGQPVMKYRIQHILDKIQDPKP